jgi:lipid-binding SYLF domain-containing protein
MMLKKKTASWLWTLAGATLLLGSALATADEAAKAAEIVTKARATLKNFLDDPDMKWARDNLSKAKGVLIVPTYAKAGFVLGGAGGQGVLLAQDKSGTWAGPVFYYMGAASIGLQAGVDVAEVLMLVMTDKGIDALLAGDVKMGADARVAAGPVGTGASAATADILGYSRSKGLFAGIAFDGSVVNPSKDKNAAYYGEGVSPTDVLIRRSASNPDGKGLLDDIKAAEGR